ncbi:MAG: phosphoribosylformylglycinamidine synthase, partial [Candidatus Krumholzibacteriota bacterium]|nr:phosphoribosylformylglycinamidine synthase [Candidatus Krumholzibacteriota bacterium]
MTKIRDEDLIPVDPSDENALRSFLKDCGISLTTSEYARVCDLIGRPPTLVELHIFNIMWSEHCSYKSSRPTLGEFLPTEAPHVVLGPGEDAGIIRFAEIDGRSVCLVMAHESHNHPSQVLPVEGAATGIGGIVRDVYCMGADVIGVMDPLRFGDPDGPNASRVRDIAWGVIDGIAQYSNALGVPNYGGETFFDASFDDNCLVNVVAFGLVDEDSIVRSRVPDEARKEPYDVILIGKPTDASGFGGAAFASERLSEEEAVERQGAVQVPDPFLKRVLAEAGKEMLAWAKRDNVPIGYKDLGAGGISCAVSEMAEAAGFGVAIDLDAVNVAFDALRPEVISCSETQERFLLAVPSRCSEEVVAIYNERFELPHLYEGAGAVVIGRVTPEERFS